MKAAILFCCLVSCGLLCGCCSVYIAREFNGPSDVCLVDELTSKAWIAPRTTTFGTPLLLEYQQRSAPYDLRIQISDPSRTFKSIEITEVEVAYSDGEVIRKNMLWQRNISRSSSPGNPSSETTINETIEDILDRHLDATITLKGHVTTSNGDVVTFTSAAAFKAEKSSFMVVPLFLHGA